VNREGIRVVVPSVMHSGTHVLRYKILRAFFKDNEDTCLFNANTKNELVWFHVDQEHRHVECQDSIVVIPMRHPRRIAKSWKSRERTPARRPYNEENLYSQLSQQMDLDKYNPLYVHIDMPEIRDKQVQELSELLGLDLHYDWVPDRVSGSIAGNWDAKIEQCPEVPGVYIEWYYKTAGMV
jgi:hypothetical protein